MKKAWDVSRILLLGISAATLCACASAPEKKTPYEPDQGKFADLEEAARRFGEYKTAEQSSPLEIQRYLDSGVTLSNTACELWFTDLAKTERDTTLNKNLMNVVGNFILGIAGINSTNPATIGKGALGLSAANTAFEVYRADVLLGDIEEIRAKIREDRTVAEDSLMARTDISFDTARRRLLEYHQLCSVERIKVLLKTSLSAVKFERPDLSLSSPTDKAKAMVLTANLQSSLGNVNVLLQNEDLLYQLYLVLILFKTEDAADPIVVRNARNNQVVATYVRKFGNLGSPDLQDSVLNQLQQIAIALRFGERLKTDTAAEANQKLAEAQKAFADADARVNTLLGELNADRQAMQAFGVTEEQKSGKEFAASVRKVRSLKQIHSSSMSDACLKEAIEVYWDKERLLSIATAGAQRLKAGALPSVTPKIVTTGH